MADISDIETALVSAIAGALYPNGIGQPSAVGVDCYVYPGWPQDTELRAKLASGAVTVTVFPQPNIERVTTRYPKEWVQVSANAPTITTSVSGNVVTLSGSITAGNYVTVTVANAAASYVIGASDTLTSAAQGLASQIAGATASGATIVLPAVKSGRISAITAAPQTIRRELKRQERGVLISIWAASPMMRAMVGALIEPALVVSNFLTISDGSLCRLTYRSQTEMDGKEVAMAYRRDLSFWVEYATTQDAIGYPVTFFGSTNALMQSIPFGAGPMLDFSQFDNSQYLGFA